MSIRNTFSARVLPGVWDTRAIRWPTRAFSRLDLPTLERPMRASSGSDGSSGTSARGNDPTDRKSTRLNSSLHLVCRLLLEKKKKDSEGSDEYVVNARETEI